MSLVRLHCGFASLPCDENRSKTGNPNLRARHFMILVIGGTGLIGNEVLRLLSQAGVPARALVRNPQKAKKLPGITWIAGDLAKTETLTTAFEGAKSLFLLTHYLEDMVELQHNAIVAARAAGV